MKKKKRKKEGKKERTKEKKKTIKIDIKRVSAIAGTFSSQSRSICVLRVRT